MSDVEPNWAHVLADYIASMSPGSTIRVGDWIKDSNGEGFEHVHVSNETERWIEARFYGVRYWMFTESAFESHMHFLGEVGSPEEQAADSAEEMEWAARVCVAYLGGDFEPSAAIELLLPRWGRNLFPKRVRTNAITIYPPGGESAQFLPQRR